jgi:hypothetical protein
MSSKISFRNIVAAHLRTLKNYDSGRYRPADFIIFFVLPAAAALLTTALGAGPSDGLNTSLVLFAGLTGVAMVSALSVLLNLSSDAHGNACAQSSHSTTRLTLIKESHANISYALLASVLLATASISHAVFGQHAGGDATALLKHSALFVCIYLAANLSLSLLMALKRLTVLLTKQLEAE